VTISALFDGSSISIGTSSRVAGAIDSITWKGKQFVDALDHGREFQSATTFSGKGECFNPTEAGARDDGAAQHSSSKLIKLTAAGSVLQTTSQMAFWLGPNEKTAGCHGSLSTNSNAVSTDALNKAVSIGVDGIANAIKYDATFQVPENRTLGGFEVLAAYLPGEFSVFQTYDIAHDKLALLSDGPGQQPLPIIFSTADNNYALGHSSAPIYSRWRFAEANRPDKVVKTNCYFLEHDVSAGDHHFACYLVIGTLPEVRSGLQALNAKLQKP
jgi:hypothetical protein